MSTCDRAVEPVLLTRTPRSWDESQQSSQWHTASGGGTAGLHPRLNPGTSPSPPCSVGMWSIPSCRILESLERSERRRVALSWRGHPALPGPGLTLSTSTPMCVTARLICVPSPSLAGCGRIPYISSFLATSSSCTSDSAGVFPLQAQTHSRQQE